MEEFEYKYVQLSCMLEGEKEFWYIQLLGLDIKLGPVAKLDKCSSKRDV
jgi:hypothetical protein